jgi:hypothetical protein
MEFFLFLGNGCAIDHWLVDFLPSFICSLTARASLLRFSALVLLLPWTLSLAFVCAVYSMQM